MLKSKNSKGCEDSFGRSPLTSISQLKQVRKHLWSYLSQSGGSEQSKGLFLLVPQVELAGYAHPSRNQGGTNSCTGETARLCPFTGDRTKKSRCTWSTAESGRDGGSCPEEELKGVDLNI